MGHTLKVYFVRGRRAFSQPEGLFEWDIDAFDVRCKLNNYGRGISRLSLRVENIMLKENQTAVLDEIIIDARYFALHQEHSQ